MFACPGLIFYTVCSVPWLNGNLALAGKCSGPLRFRLRQVLLYNVCCLVVVVLLVAAAAAAAAAATAAAAFES